MSSTAEELASQSEQLQHSVGFFRIGSESITTFTPKAAPRTKPVRRARTLAQAGAQPAADGAELNLDEEDVAFEKY
ncbi:hypothetical protein [Geomesophilobacter sediminis]|uniref:hypothetical protein n=1 Tax=Geomesophilobacter sediminis TaxID=2798584 RepID=UPI001F2D0DE6|nr:hypothetical protein [Geomesophilobacter sediminis]